MEGYSVGEKDVKLKNVSPYLHVFIPGAGPENNVMRTSQGSSGAEE
jgi:hypothetical protein